MQRLPAQETVLAKLFAASLVALILTPFTAPFATCDLSSPLKHTAGERSPSAPRADTAAAVNAAAALVPSRVTSGRAKQGAAKGLRLAHTGPVSTAGIARFAVSRTPPQRVGARLAILRV